jgi:cell growth-regulating nucleolar protein
MVRPIALTITRTDQTASLPACGDVVKKPKLDQHRMKCHSGFDCLDCQTTFNTASEYKGHTSCITEAQKYEKGLFKGPKTPVRVPHDSGEESCCTYCCNQYGQNNGDVPQRRGGFQSSRGFGHRGRSDVAGRRNWGQPRYEATGANDTPLGTPKMTPVTRSPDPPDPAAAAQPTTMPQATSSSASGNKRKTVIVDGETVSLS